MTSDDPRQMFAMTNSSTPSCQFVPVTRHINVAASAPVQAKVANSFVG